ncbi:MAG: hypothetical protein ACJAX4_003689 [Clostridium sp.]|jgi:hypothetical protein
MLPQNSVQRRFLFYVSINYEDLNKQSIHDNRYELAHEKEYKFLFEIYTLFQLFFIKFIRNMVSIRIKTHY